MDKSTTWKLYYRLDEVGVGGILLHLLFVPFDNVLDCGRRANNQHIKVTSLFSIYSSTKNLTATMTHLLVTILE